jgi:hypothetical protein
VFRGKGMRHGAAPAADPGGAARMGPRGATGGGAAQEASGDEGFPGAPREP